MLNTTHFAQTASQLNATRAQTRLEALENCNAMLSSHNLTWSDVMKLLPGTIVPDKTPSEQTVIHVDTARIDALPLEISGTITVMDQRLTRTRENMLRVCLTTPEKQTWGVFFVFDKKTVQTILSHPQETFSFRIIRSTAPHAPKLVLS